MLVCCGRAAGEGRADELGGLAAESAESAVSGL
jgi:hypothetical protein